MTSVGDELRRLRSQARSALLIRGVTELAGSVQVQGAKNTALKIIPGLAAFPRVYSLRNTPKIIDTLELFAVLEHLGAVVEFGPEVIRVDTRDLVNKPVPFDLTKRTTTAFYLAGALLSRFGSVEIGKPGGDEIGARPVDLHIAAFQAAGATVDEADTAIKAVFDGGAARGELEFRMPSAGATVNAALAAANGRVSIKNYPTDADMRGFFDFLRRCGCLVSETDGWLIVDGTDKTNSVDVEFACPPDRNDAMTWLQAGALSPSGITVTNVDAADVKTGLVVLEALGIPMTIHDDAITVRRPNELRIPDGFSVVAGASPQFHSDWAPILQLVLCSATGSATTVDTLHSDRVRQAEILKEMGADVTFAGGEPPDGVNVYFRIPLDEARYQVSTRGPARLTAIDASVGNDVRACATAVLAATQAKGQSRLTGIYALFRGYEEYPTRLDRLGAQIGFE